MIALHRLLAAGTLILLAAGWGFAAGPAAAPAAAPIPSASDARQLFSDAKYNEVIRAISKITSMREWQATKPDAYELYTLKAEAHLRLKESALAAASFELAAKAATDQMALDKAAADKSAAASADKATPDEALLAKVNADRAAAGVARATAYLVKHSIGPNYVPKATANQRVAGGSPEDHIKLDIVNPDTRKQALTAVWTDEKKASEARFNAASNTDNKSMQAVIDATPFIAPLRDFDFAANGSDDDTRKIAGQIAEHGRDLLQEMADKMMLRLDVISSQALAVERSRVGLPGGGYVDRWRKHGMEGKQQSELQEMVVNASKISTAVKILNDGLLPEKGFFDKVSKDIKRIKDSADKVLKANYTESYTTRDAAMKS